MSTTPSSCQGSTLPPSRGCSAAMGGVPIMSKVTIPTSPVPLRTLQISQQAYNSQTCPLSRTFSVHDLNAASQPKDLPISALPPYGCHADEDGDTECGDNQNDFPLQSTQLPGFGEASIDEISPGEDDRVAEAALYAPGMYTSSIKFSANNTPGARLSIPWCKFSTHGLWCSNTSIWYIYFLYQICY